MEENFEEKEEVFLDETFKITPKKVILAILGIIGTIFLGALGSGLWEIIIKPFFNYLGGLSLNLFFSIFNIIKQITYLEIAKGNNSSIVIDIKEFIYKTAGCYLLFTVFKLNNDAIKLKQEALKIKKDCESYDKIAKNNEIVDPKKVVSILKIRTENCSRSINKTISVSTILGFIAIFIIVFIHTSLNQDRYINNAISYFNQSYTICIPYLSNNDRLLINSEFAQVSSKEDYVLVINKLEKTAKVHKLKLPKFKIW